MQENKVNNPEQPQLERSETTNATHERYMRRCIDLALNGREGAKPNPMVGSVIVVDGRIIGEGYHIEYGKAHAEVNAFASVEAKDEHLLPKATLYVSLEPCSHFGKTPPCSDLIISKGVKKVVVGCVDPYSEVSGRGIERLRKAGVEVLVGVLEKECLFLNRFFITSNTLQRPYIILKWAQTLDGFIDCNGEATAISIPFTSMLVHKLRAESDAILVGNNTEKKECPRLNVRHWSGRDPKKVVLSSKTTIPELLSSLHAENIQSLMVEGGLKTHNSFIEADLWDEIHIETAPFTVGKGTRAPQIPANAKLIEHEDWDGNQTFVLVKENGLLGK